MASKAPSTAGSVAGSRLGSRQSSRNGMTSPPPDPEPIDPAKDPRRMRRIFAEDPQWNMAAVPSLVQLCFDNLTNNYGQNPVVDDLSNPDFKERLINSLDTSLPLNVTAGIEHEDYWKRKVESMTQAWGPCNVKEHGNSWKRLFFERRIQELLEQCKPEEEEEQMDSILHVCKLGRSSVKRLAISQLIPPDHGEPEVPRTLLVDDDEDELDGDQEDDDDEKPNNDHIDITPVIKELAGLEDLNLSYLVKNCGMNFKWNMFGITTSDCGTLMRSIRDYSKLSSLSLTRSLIGDHKARILCSFLLGNKTLKRLDLSHNSIEDSGARAIAKLISSSLIDDLDLCNNKIQSKGAKALGMSLRENSRLQALNLRLNRFGESGGRLFFQGITGNSALESLNVSCNSLGHKSAVALCEYVDHNPALKRLDLTCNEMGVQAGSLILEALDGNTVIQTIDMRLTKFDKDTEFQINVILQSNRKAT